MSTEALSAAHKHPRGACWSAWYYGDFASFGRCVARIEDRQIAIDWLQKLNELDAADEYREEVAERVEELR